jgi:hypothetical protein
MVRVSFALLFPGMCVQRVYSMMRRMIKEERRWLYLPSACKISSVTSSAC